MKTHQLVDYPIHYNALITELSIATIERITHVLSPVPVEEIGRADFYDHMYQSDFEIAFDALWCLGLAHGLVTDEGQQRLLTKEDWPQFKQHDSRYPGMPPLFCFESEGDIRRNFSITMVDEPPSTGCLFDAYFRVATNYAPLGGELPTGRDPFPLPSANRARLVTALIKNGYITKMNGQFSWTGKVGCYMPDGHRWSERRDDELLRDQDEIIHQSEIILGTLALHEAPKSVQYHCTGNILEVIACAIMHFWTGQTWSHKALREPVVFFDEAMAIAELIKSAISDNPPLT